MVAVQFGSMRTSLDLYLIAAGNKRFVLFSPLNIVEGIEEEAHIAVGEGGGRHTNIT